MGQFRPQQQSDCGNSLSENEVVLQHAVEKLVLFGQRFGVSPEEMISLLDSGISLPDLLTFLASKSSSHA
jgi:hypothetical protein